jgi:GT2 family glycosyltransferase
MGANGAGRTAMEKPFVSVLLATRGRPEDMARCLPTILGNGYAELEVIIIDQSDDDATERAIEGSVREAAEKGAKWELVKLESASVDGLRPPAKGERRIIYRRPGTVGATRGWNEGFTYCRGDVLAFTDDDCTVPSDWISRGVRTLGREPEAGMLFGEFVPIPHNPSRTYIPSFRPEKYGKLEGELSRLKCDYVASGNMFVRRRVFEELNGFDECLGPGARFRGGDDVDLTYRALRAGFTVVLDPKNTVVHWGGRDYADGSGRQILRDYYYAVGARQIKQIRCGDYLAIYAFGRSVVRELAITAGNLIRYGKPTGAGRQLEHIRGALDGLSHPVDRGRWLYRPTEK